ncbi:MAG: hypothetical protein OES26_26285 [Gammaproteobacteria bacterium]|nr:hypothetical protein [Gammaproteobacteria bacterium]
MKLLASIVIILALCQSPAYSYNDCAKAACAEVKAKISNVKSKMRSGYTRAQGERYEKKLRVLKARRSKLCR